MFFSAVEKAIVQSPLFTLNTSPHCLDSSKESGKVTSHNIPVELGNSGNECTAY